jgi:hypothetical protein
MTSVAGSNRVHYPGNARTQTTKLFINSIISMEYVKFKTMDIKDFYLNML